MEADSLPIFSVSSAIFSSEVLTSALRVSISLSPSANLALSASISLAASAEGAGRAVVRDAAVKDPEVESRLLAVGVAPVVRVAVVRVAEALGVAAVRLVVVLVRGAAVVVDAGRRVAVVEPVAPTVLFSAVLAGLDAIELVLRAEAMEEVVDFLSSSLALMLGRLRWLDIEVAVGGRRTVEPGGRVGGLLRPPGARVLEAVVGLAVEEEDVAPGRRVAVAEAAPGCLRAGFAPGLSFAFSFTGVSGDEGVAGVAVA